MTVPDLETLLRQAASLQRQQKWSELYTLLIQVYARYAPDERVLAHLATSLIRQSQPGFALPYAMQACILAPNSAEAHTRLGIVYSMLGMLDMAERKLSEALKLNPACDDALRIQVVIFSMQARHAEARAALKSLLNLKPGDAEAQMILAQYQEMEQDYKAAAKTLRDLLKKQPDHARAAQFLGRLELNSVRPHEAFAEKGPIDPHSLLMSVPDARIDRRVLDEARSLIRAGWHVTVVADPPMPTNPWWDEELYPDVPIIRTGHRRALLVTCFDRSIEYSGRLNQPFPAPAILDKAKEMVLPGNFLGTLLMTANEYFLEALEHPSRVYVAHDFPVTAATALAAALNGAYFVYDSHELYPAMLRNETQQRDCYEADRFMCGLADKVITVNQSIAAEFQNRYKVLPEVILNCPSYKVEEAPLPRSDILRRDLNIPKGKKILLYQGNMAIGVRNLENVLAAMKALKRDDIVFVLMGHDYGQRAPLEDLARRLGVLGRRVFFHEAVRQDKLLSLTASADAGIIPYPPLELNSLYCTPNKLFEFLVAGLPILANDLPELRRFVNDQGVGMNMPMTNEQDIAQAIETFFASNLDAYRERYKTISPQYVWQVEGEKIVKIYEHLGERPPRLEEFTVKIRNLG